MKTNFHDKNFALHNEVQSNSEMVYLDLTLMLSFPSYLCTNNIYNLKADKFKLFSLQDMHVKLS